MHSTIWTRKPAMTPEIIVIDHIYISVNDLGHSEPFYDTVMEILGFRKSRFAIDGDAHVQYYNRLFGDVLRPARHRVAHDAYAPGLHHLSFRVETAEDVRTLATRLQEAGIDASEPRLHPEYAPDYHATFLRDPDGIRLDITNYRLERRQRHDHWNET